MALASGFADGDEAAWRALVEKTLDGQPFERRLVSRTHDGLTVQPLYTARNSVPPLPVSSPARETAGRWDLRVSVDHADPAAANLAALDDLNGGATSLLVRVDPTGSAGVAIGSVDDMQRVLADVLIDLAPVALDAGVYGVQAAHWLIEAAETRTLRPKLALHIDPLSALAETGVASGGIDAFMGAAGQLVVKERAHSVFLASGRTVHEAGGGESAELGFALASGLTYARAAVDAGASIEQAFKAVVLGVSVDGDYFMGMAKLRALRAAWSRLTEVTTGAALQAVIEARSSRRMLSVLDPWVNMLRLSVACFSAATGGADTVVLDPFSQPLGRATAFARRQSRNTQLVLMEESHLGRVADPAAGSWYLETLSREIAESAWAFMQRIEAAGGVVAALESGLIAETVATVASARDKDIARRKTGMIGVSEFPDLAEAGVNLDLVDPTAFAKAPPPPVGTGPDSRCEPLRPWRAAAPFEALRHRAAAMTPRPKAALITLGSPADYAGRVGFARNLLASGGIASEVLSPEDFDPGQATVAILCSSDALYAETGVATARVLKEKGARRVYLAGRPGDLEVALQSAGVDEFIFAGTDAVAFLDRTLTLMDTRP